MISRREFVKDCGFTCAGLIGISILFEACKPLKQINATVKDQIITISVAQFGEPTKKSQRSLLVRTTELPAPILVYNLGKDQYSALLLQCSHQGAELSVSGDILTCPAHGSEFDNKGAVIQGPAEHNLSKYKVTKDNEHITIHLT